jgi:hypothetical protein
MERGLETAFLQEASNGMSPLHVSHRSIRDKGSDEVLGVFWSRLKANVAQHLSPPFHIQDTIVYVWSCSEKAMKTSCGIASTGDQVIENGGSLEVAFLLRILFRLFAPPFGLFFEILLKLQSPNHVIRF